ncbi:GAF domain-containing sensor histidine kinase [Streptomyces sp. 4N509B]|uniref:GAF domain-containing sensor histidine kinase n=1 Tax=Streptomyces sp. 4N509B TaxID=3457413 RepID=UPI003FD5060B
MEGIAPELARRMPRLLQTLEYLAGDVELRTQLDRVVTAAAELVGARCGALAVLNEDGSGVGEFVTHGVPEAPDAADAEGPDEQTAEHRRRELIRAMRQDVNATDARLLAEISADPRCAGFPPSQPRPRSLTGVPIRVHSAGYGALYLADKTDGGPFTPDDRQLMRILATGAGIAVSNARLHEAVRQQARWMDGSLELTLSLLSEDGAGDNALAVVAEQARRLAHTAVAVILEPRAGSRAGARAEPFAEPFGEPHGEPHAAPGDEPGDDRAGRDGRDGTRGPDMLEVVAVSADEPSGLLGAVVPADSSPLRRVLAGEPVFIDDPGTVAEPFIDAALVSRYGPRMALPLASDGRTVGVLAVARARGAVPFTVPERALATQFAQQAALALVLVRARVDREQLAVLEDRDRIARDLHDLVIQRLFAVGMILEGAERASRPRAPNVAVRIDSAARELDATIQEIRTAIFALQQPPDEVPRGLRTRVLRETGAAGQTLGFTPSVSFAGPVDVRVPENVANNLVAALREALSNAARHADPSRVEVTVEVADDQVRLTVTDNGVGLPQPGGADPAAESGLRNLRRRAEELGGSAQLSAGPEGQGTTVSWQAPLER